MQGPIKNIGSSERVKCPFWQLAFQRPTNCSMPHEGQSIKTSDTPSGNENIIAFPQELHSAFICNSRLGVCGWISDCCEVLGSSIPLETAPNLLDSDGVVVVSLLDKLCKNDKSSFLQLENTIFIDMTLNQSNIVLIDFEDYQHNLIFTKDQQTQSIFIKP